MQQTINGLSIGSVYALLGLGVTLVWGVLHILTFAHAQILTWGAFATLVSLEVGLPIPVALLVGATAAGLLAVVIDATVLEALRRRRGPEFSFVVATIGVAIMLESVLRSLTDGETVPFPLDGFPRGTVAVFGQQVPVLQLAILGISLVVMALLTGWLRYTTFGRAVRATAFSRETAELLGINTRLVYWSAQFASGVLAALAGAFVAVVATSVSYSSGDPLLLVAFAVIILGGMGSVTGAVVGGLLLGVLEVYATVHVSSVFREAVAFLLILVVLMVRPSGLFQEKETTRV